MGPSLGRCEGKKRVLMRPLSVNKDLAPAASILLGIFPFKDKLYSQKSVIPIQCGEISRKVCQVVMYMTQKSDYDRKHDLKG